MTRHNRPIQRVADHHVVNSAYIGIAFLVVVLPLPI
jgi:hypothetical protein